MAVAIRGSVLTLGTRARAVAGEVLADVIQAGAEGVVSDARAKWPVRTGRSRAGLGATRVEDRTRIRGTAPYTILVHEGEAWTDLVERPVADLVRVRAPREAGPKIVRALRVPGG